MIEILAEIIAPVTPTQKSFTCGVVLRDEKVIEAAPRVKWMKGWTRDAVRDYCKMKGWRVIIVTRTINGRFMSERVIKQIEEKLAYRTPQLDKPMAHIVLSREDAEELVTVWRALSQSHSPSTS